MFIPERCVYFTTMIGWEKDVDSDPETADAFAAATREALAQAAEVLGTRGRGQSGGG